MASGNAAASVATGLYRHTGFWRFDIKAIVGGVILGIVMVLVQQVTARLDTALSGGAFMLIGGATWAGLMGISTLLCRQPGGVITGVIQGVIAAATAVSPLSIAFAPVNAIGSLGYALVAWKLPMSNWAHHALAQIVGNVVANVAMGLAILSILNLPMSIVLLSSAINIVAGIIGGTILTKLIADAVAKSGVMD